MISSKEIVKYLKEHVDSNIKLPQGITFVASDDSVTITLSQKAIGLVEKGASNMQEDVAAFEGWVLALYVHFLHSCGSVTLNAVIPEKYTTEFNCDHCHYNRFLFRVMKFSEQFSSWFHISKDIAGAVASFKQFLASYSFVNNIGEGKAGNNGNLENIVERFFADQNPEALRKLLQKDSISLNNHINRQLPTGLFKGEMHKENAIFTGNKSAIDLWTEEDKAIFIFELKARNKMIGIISELFFYSNYMYDMFCDHETKFVPSPAKNSKEHRGYESLLSSDGDKNHNWIHAFFLSDQRHQLITDEVIKLLNTDAKGITYKWIDYNLDIDVEKTAAASTEE
ncbi:hypothetical protein V6615_11335 [Oscillospiraceae bacterium PP1C4]